MSDPRSTTAAHEAGHATAAWTLGKRVVLVSLSGPYGGGPCSIDREYLEPLQGRRRPSASEHWRILEDDVIITLAGPLCEGFADEAEPDDPLDRVRLTEPRRLKAGITPVVFQSGPEPPADEPIVWNYPENDHDAVDRACQAMSSSEVEAAAFGVALRHRAEAFVQHPHFRALHRRLTAALLREGELTSSDIVHELERAHFGYAHTNLSEADPNAEAA